MESYSPNLNKFFSSFDLWAVVLNPNFEHAEIGETVVWHFMYVYLQRSSNFPNNLKKPKIWIK